MPDVLRTSGFLSVPGLRVRPQSVAAATGAEFAVADADPANPRLVVLALAGSPVLADLEGEPTEHAGQVLLLGPRSARNLEALRRALAWLQPQVLGLRTSAGFGDRLGLATPGHIRALRAVGGGLAPVFAQRPRLPSRT